MIRFYMSICNHDYFVNMVIYEYPLFDILTKKYIQLVAEVSSEALVNIVVSIFLIESIFQYIAISKLF